jgi:hypothetical protein
MNDNVIKFNGITRLDIDPKTVLKEAEHLESVVIVGYDPEGKEYFASSVADGGEVLWLLERAKLSLLRTVDDE